MSLVLRPPIGLPVVMMALILHQLPSLPELPYSAMTLGAALLALLLAFCIKSLACRLLLWSCVFTALQLMQLQQGLTRLAPSTIQPLNLLAQVQVLGLPIRDEQGWRFKARVVRLEGADSTPSAIGKDLQLHWSAGYTAASGSALPADLIPGQYWRLELRLRPWRALRNPVLAGPADPRVRAMEEGLWARAQVRTHTPPVLLAQTSNEICMRFECVVLAVDRARYHVRRALIEQLEQDHARVSAMMVALVLGDQSMIAGPDWARFNRTGIGHLISISGLHVTMIAAVGGWLSSLLWRRLVLSSRRCAAWAQRYCSHAMASRIGALSVGALYCLFAGAQVPAQRTFWMLLALALITISRRRCATLLSLSWAAIVVLALDPWAVASPGFWLSFVATWALMQGLKPSNAGDLTPIRWLARGWHLFRAGARAQWIVTLGLIPLSACLFGYFSLLSPIANALAIPLISYVVTPLALLGALIWAFAQGVGAPLSGAVGLLLNFVWKLSALALEQMMRALAWMESQTLLPAVVPLAGPGHLLGLACVVAAFLGMLVLVLGHHWRSRLVAFCLLVPVFIPGQHWPLSWREHKLEGLEITSFDLGSGSAILVRTPDLTILYDTGAGGLGTALTGASIGQDQASRVVLPYLRERGIVALDLVVVSHSDREHQAGLASILSAIPVRALLLPHQHSCSGSEFSTQHTSVELFKWEKARHANEASCVLRIGVGKAAGDEQSVLLLGDLTPNAQKILADTWPEQRLRSSVVQMPGQGAKNTWHASFLSAVSPKMALIQVAQAHWRAYPRPEALAPLERLHTHIFRTDLDGAVSIRLIPGRPASIWREKYHAPRYFESSPESSAQ